MLKTDLELMDVKAVRLPFNPTAEIPKTNVQEAIEAGFAGQAPSSAAYLVQSADPVLSAERVVGDSTSIVADWATAGAVAFKRAALTGDVAAGADSNSTTIQPDVVTFAKMQNIATDRLLGRDTAGTGDPEEISLNATLEFTGAGAIQRAALTGDIAAAAGSNATTLATVNANVGTFGSATQTPTFTVNGKGLVTAASHQNISIPSTQINDFTEAVQDVAGGMWTGNTEVGVSVTYEDSDGTLDITVTGVLEDLNTLGAPASDGQFIVATGAGAFAYESGDTARTSLGVGTGDSPQFTAVNVGHATDTTLTRVASGRIAVEGNELARYITLASTTIGEGAALIGVSDSGGYYTGTNVEAALQEIGADIAALDQAIILKGSWDASAGTFPGAGAAQAGWKYIVSVAGTVDGVAFAQNDTIVAIADNASTTTYANNWFKQDFTDQVLSVAGKTGAVTLVATDITDFTEAVQDVIGATWADSSEIDFSYNDGSNSITASLITNAVAYSKLAQGSALSVLGVTGNATADLASIAAANDGEVLRRAGTALAFGTVATAGIANDAVTFAKMQNLTTDRLLGRDTASTGDPEEISLDSTLEFTGSASIRRAALTGDVAAAAGSNSTAIQSNVVTFAKMQDIATDRLIGRDTAASGDPEEISVGGGLEFTGSAGIQRSALTGAVVASAGSNATTSTFDIVVSLDGALTAITTGVKAAADLHFDFACTITGWTLTADQTGSIVIDVWKDTYANFPPTVADTIAGTEKPTISAAVKGQDTSLSTWTTSVAAGDMLRFNVDSVTDITACTLVLKATKTS